MPITYVRDDELNLVKLTVAGGVTIDEWQAAMTRQIEEGDWRRGTLYTAADHQSPQPRAELLEMLRRLETLITEHGPRGPVAYVAQYVADYGRSREYSGLVARFGFDYETFTDADEAVQWLLERQASGASA